MSDFMIARTLFASTLVFHIVFAGLGIGFPLLMAFAELMHRKTGNKVWRQLAMRWSRAVVVLFAVGAVSGTVVSMQLGLLWPEFMKHAGPIIGMPMGLEGFAFFIETIFLGIYLFGWNRMEERAHIFAGFMVAAGSTLSGILIITANGWMNTPQGFDYDPVTGVYSNIDPWAAMLNPAALHEILHMIAATYASTGFLIAGIHAYALLREKKKTGDMSEFHKKGFTLALVMAMVGTALVGVTGDYAATRVAELQPVKFAAMEGHYETEECAALIIGGFPDDEAGETKWAIEIPCMLSFLAEKSFDAEVKGLNEWSEDERPPTAVVHFAFDAMVGLGSLMALLSAIAGFLWWRNKEVPLNPKLLWGFVLGAPSGFLALELGWIVTEVGRQPWTIVGYMRTEDAVTDVDGLALPFALFLFVYALLSVVTFEVLRRQFRVPPEPTSSDKEEVEEDIDEDDLVTQSNIEDESSDDTPQTNEDSKEKDDGKEEINEDSKEKDDGKEETNEDSKEKDDGKEETNENENANEKEVTE